MRRFSGTNIEKKNRVALFPSEKKRNFPVFKKNTIDRGYSLNTPGYIFFKFAMHWNYKVYAFSLHWQCIGNAEK